MEKTYIQKLSGIPANFIAIAFIICIGGATFLYYQQIIIGLIFIAFGIGIATIRDAIQINFNTNEFRKCIIFFGLKIGNWQNFEIPDYIVLVRVKDVFAVSSRVQSVQFSEYKYKINFVYGKKFETFSKCKYEKAFKLASQISANYKVKLLDNTKRNKKK